MFDRQGYLRQYDDVRNSYWDPVCHYLRYGAREGRIPHPSFDTAYYLRTYPDVAASGLNPLLHYLKFGRKEGRRANGLSDSAALSANLKSATPVSEIAISKIVPLDVSSTNPRYATWKYIIPLPPDSLAWAVGATTIESFLVVGDAWAQLVSRFTALGCSVLDIGCGCGRTARGLINNMYIDGYVGFDVIPENVEWCQNYIQARAPHRFIFRHYDIHSREYNPEGRLLPSEFQFPCQERSMTVVFAASVFTHLLEPDARHYLNEIERVLTPGGKAILSIHVNVPTDKPFHGTEARIDIDPQYFLGMCADAHLELVEALGEVCDQEVFVFASKRR
jgi:SAM-dependent methyltransferase